MIRTICSALFPILLASSALAVERPAFKSTVGNGGDAVVCRYYFGRILNAEVLDLYEGRATRGVRFSVPNELDSADAILKFVLDRFAQVDPVRAENYRKAVAEFPHEAVFTDETLADVPDFGVLTLKPDCAIEQLAVQKPKTFPADRRYLVQKQIWNHWIEKQNYLQIAAITLHEVIYTDFLEHGHTTSEGTRYFNSSLFGGTFNTFTADQYQDVLSTLNLK